MSVYLGQERSSVWLLGTGAGWCLATWDRSGLVSGYLGHEGWCLATWDRSRLVSGYLG